MELILWRHAEAEEGLNDLQRRLTSKGHQQAKSSAAWLKNHLPRHPQVWVSEAARSRQTAFYLSKDTQTVPLLNPTANVGLLPDLLRRQQANVALVWVGHQPWIGQMCAWLLNGNWPAQAYWSVKKSGFWWFELSFDAAGNPVSKLKTVLTPAVLKKG